jgi:hypothetical protein
MNEERTETVALFGEYFHRSRVDQDRQLLLAFGTIDCCISSGIDDDLWLECAHDRYKGLWLREVGLVSIEGDHLP